MTELLERAVEKVRGLTPQRQDDLARVLLQLTGDDETVIDLTSDEEADLIEAQSEMARGEYATEAEVQAVLAKYRL